MYVIYGSSSGLTPTGSQFWTQDSAGIPDEAEAGDRFGTSLVAANFGKSSHADLAIGVEWESAGTRSATGAVHVLYGSANGLTGTGSQFWTQDSSGIVGAAEPDDFFGSALAAANLGKSTHADLAVGVPLEDVGTLRDAGGVHVLYGSTNGLTATGSQFWTQNSAGVAGDAESGDRFGRSLVAANFGRSVYGDLAVGVPTENVGAPNCGGVHVIYGSANGLTGMGSQFWTENSTGIFGEREASDEFGASLAAANFGKSPHADLAVGVPTENAGPTIDTGGVHVIYGSSNGLSGTGSQFWNAEQPGCLRRI